MLTDAHRHIVNPKTHGSNPVPEIENTPLKMFCMCTDFLRYVCTTTVIPSVTSLIPPLSEGRRWC